MVLQPTIRRCLLFDWGDTLMRDFPEFDGPMASWPRVECVPHAESVLPDLHDRWIIGLATNAIHSGEAAIRSALERGGIARYIDRIFCFKNIGVKKPSPDFFESILRAVGIDRRHVVFVGDAYETDIAGALKAGIRAVWLRTDPLSGESRPSIGDDPAPGRLAIIDDLLQLPDALERLKPSGRNA
jgi:putative hydrolase of the HAD superfamily